MISASRTHPNLHPTPITPPILKKTDTTQLQSLVNLLFTRPQQIQKPVFEVTVKPAAPDSEDGDNRAVVGPSERPPATRVFGDHFHRALPNEPPPDNSLLDQLNAAQKEYDKEWMEAERIVKLVGMAFSYLHRCKKNLNFISSIVEINHWTFAAYTLIPPLIKATTHLNLIYQNSTLKLTIDNIQISIERAFTNQAASQSEGAADVALRASEKAAQARCIHLHRIQTNDRKLSSEKIRTFLIKELPVVIMAYIVKLMPCAKGTKKPLLEVLKNLNQIFVAKSYLFKQNELVYSLTPVQDLSQTDVVSSFLEGLKKCQNLQEVVSALTSARINEEILPEQFEQFRFLMEHSTRYQNEIRNRFLYSHHKKSPFIRLSEPHPSNTLIVRSYANGQYIEQLLEKRQETVQTKIASMKQDIKNKIDATHDGQNFGEIKRYFRSLSIDLDQPEIGVTSREALLQVKDNDQLMELLAQNRLSAIETKASSAVHAVRTILLSKHPEERSLLHFTMCASILSALFGGIQLSFCFSEKFKSFFSETLFKTFSKNLINVPNVGLLFVLFPTTSIKVLSIFLTIGKHIFCKQYKPNEYSAEGYKLRLKIGVYKAFCYFYLGILFFQKACLWLNISLIEHRIMKMEINDNDDRYKWIDAEMQSCKNERDKNVTPLEREYSTLQEKDVDFMLNSHNNGKNINNKNLKAIDTIIQTLDKDEFQFYQQEFQDFLNRHLALGIKQDGSTALTQEKIANQVRKLFTSEGEEFIGLHQGRQTLHPFISHY